MIVLSLSFSFYQSNPDFVQVVMSPVKQKTKNKEQKTSSSVPSSKGWSYDEVLPNENKHRCYMPFDICVYSFLEWGLSAGVESPSWKHRITVVGRKVSLFSPEGKCYCYMSKLSLYVFKHLFGEFFMLTVQPNSKW